MNNTECFSYLFIYFAMQNCYLYQVSVIGFYLSFIIINIYFILFIIVCVFLVCCYLLDSIICFYYYFCGLFIYLFLFLSRMLILCNSIRLLHILYCGSWLKNYMVGFANHCVTFFMLLQLIGFPLFRLSYIYFYKLHMK